MTKLLLILPLLFCSCASQTFYRTGTNAKGGTAAVKSFQNYGDLVGNVEMSHDRLSVSLPQGPIPVARVAVVNKSGQLVSVNEIPMMPGVYNSTANASLFNGIDKSIRAGGSVAGTIGAAAVAGGVLGSAAGAVPAVVK